MEDLAGKFVAQGGLELIRFLGKSAIGWLEDHRARANERIAGLEYRTGCILNIGKITPEPVPDKIAIPILQAASLEDDETLQAKWAGLLASAADPASRHRVHPSFPDILKSLSPQEAKFLDAFSDGILAKTTGKYVQHAAKSSLHYLFVELGFARLDRADRIPPEYRFELADDIRDLNVIIDNLLARNLIAKENRLLIKDYIGYIVGQLNRPRTSDSQGVTVTGEPKTRLDYSVTALGHEFVAACRGPLPQDKPL